MYSRDERSLGFRGGFQLIVFGYFYETTSERLTDAFHWVRTKPALAVHHDEQRGEAKFGVAERTKPSSRARYIYPDIIA